MRVCFVTNSADLGGAERVLLETIDAFRGRGIECRVLLPGPGPLMREFDQMNVPYAFLDGGSWVTWTKPSCWCRVKAALKISGMIAAGVRTVSKWKCDVIYSNTITVCNASIIAKLLKLPHIWHIHEFGREDHGVSYKFGEAFSNSAVGVLSSACVVVSKALAAKYGRHIAASKLTVVYPSMHRARAASEGGSECTDARFARTGRFRMLVVGGVVEGKGQIDAIRALARLVREGIDAELFIVGESFPGYRDRLDEVVRVNNLEARVCFVGRVDNASDLMSAADMLVVCSRSEAFGRVTVEAMFAGRPVVGAASGATPELVREGFNGLLYETGNDADLASKVRFLHQHPEFAQELGDNGRSWALKYFTKARYAEEMLDVLQSVVSFHARNEISCAASAR